MEQRRSKKTEEDKKNFYNVIVARVSVSPSEKNFINTLVESSTCTTSEVLRRAVFGSAIPTSSESAFAGQLWKTIGLIKYLHKKSKGLYERQTKKIWELCINAQIALEQGVTYADHDYEEDDEFNLDSVIDESELRTESAAVRFTEAEYHDIKKKCQAEGISISHLIRSAVKKRKVKKSRVTTSLYSEFVSLGRELRGAMDSQGASIATVRSEKIIRTLENLERFLYAMTV